MENYSSSSKTNRYSRHPSRRDFLKTSAGLFAATALAPFSCQSSKLFPRRLVRFGLVTDIHYADADPRGSRHYRDSIGKLNEGIDLITSQKIDFLIELGDFKDQDEPPVEANTIKYLQTIEKIFRKSPAPSYHVLGNHDMDSLSKGQFLANVQNAGIAPDRTYYSFDVKGVYCIVLDANFTAKGDAYDHGNFDWTDAHIPPAQLDWLGKEVKAARGPIIVFTHQLLDGTGLYYIKNAAQVRQVLEESGKVLTVFQGHYHEGSYNLINGIHYYTLKAVIEGPAPDNNAYAVVEVLPDNNITVTGYRKAISKNLSASSAAQLPGEIYSDAAIG